MKPFFWKIILEQLNIPKKNDEIRKVSVVEQSERDYEKIFYLGFLTCHKILFFGISLIEQLHQLNILTNKQPP